MADPHEIDVTSADIDCAQGIVAILNLDEAHVLPLAEFRAVTRADARRQAVEECAATRCNDCRDGRPIRLASDGWEHLFENGGAFLCRAQEIRALLPPAGPGGGA